MAVVDCDVEGCHRPKRSKGLCSTHYKWSLEGKELGPINTPVQFPTPVCTWPGCGRPHYGKGLCSGHLQRHKKGIDMDKPWRKPRNYDGCSIENCDRPYVARGYCSLHYERSKTGYDMHASVRVRSSFSLCQVPGCEDLHYGSGCCKKHYHPKQTYGMSFEQIAYFENRPCQICGSFELSGIDHDHDCCKGSRSCGKCVRDVLCRACNSGLGHFKDDPGLLLAAVEYLRVHGKSA